jgi:hypothetical protein
MATAPRTALSDAGIAGPGTVRHEQQAAAAAARCMVAEAGACRPAAKLIPAAAVMAPVPKCFPVTEFLSLSDNCHLPGACGQEGLRGCVRG